MRAPCFNDEILTYHPVESHASQCGLNYAGSISDHILMSITLASATRQPKQCGSSMHTTISGIRMRGHSDVSSTPLPTSCTVLPSRVCGAAAARRTNDVLDHLSTVWSAARYACQRRLHRVLLGIQQTLLLDRTRRHCLVQSRATSTLQLSQINEYN